MMMNVLFFISSDIKTVAVLQHCQMREFKGVVVSQSAIPLFLSCSAFLVSCSSRFLTTFPQPQQRSGIMLFLRNERDTVQWGTHVKYNSGDGYCANVPIQEESKTKISANAHLS